MAVNYIEIKEDVEFHNGKCWGSSGPYRRIDGIIHFAVDPSNPANSGIVDLDKGALNEGDVVPFSSDFTLVTPVNQDPERILIDVTNRGRKKAFQDFNMSDTSGTLARDINPGDGFLFKLALDGYVLPQDIEVIVKNCSYRYEKAVSRLQSSLPDTVDEQI